VAPATPAARADADTGPWVACFTNLLGFIPLLLLGGNNAM
jgi:hypothetical protein